MYKLYVESKNKFNPKSQKYLKLTIISEDILRFLQIWSNWNL